MSKKKDTPTINNLIRVFNFLKNSNNFSSRKNISTKCRLTPGIVANVINVLYYMEVVDEIDQNAVKKYFLVDKMNQKQKSIKYLFNKDFGIDIDSEEVDSTLSLGENYRLLKRKYVTFKDINTEEL